ncbi:hypothetical protein, partial [Rhodoplanes sp. SY1]|uniref:hypothetical protein n=1 Tax=Rhodoplanes sp. SY1 TaxID=3166646 RepID=UPI0038B4FC24
MTTQMPITWPDYYSPNAELAHAIGVVSINFNSIEHCVGILFEIYVTIPNVANCKLFTKLDNSSRVTLIKDCLNGSDHNQEVKNAFSFFLDGFLVCSQNRNILMHGHVVGHAVAPKSIMRIVMSKRARGSSTENAYHIDLSEIRRIADDTYRFVEYFFEVFIFMLQSHYNEKFDYFFRYGPFRLPNRPALPAALNPRFSFPGI